jgi:hypothetical protein
MFGNKESTINGWGGKQLKTRKTSMVMDSNDNRRHGEDISDYNFISISSVVVSQYPPHHRSSRFLSRRKYRDTEAVAHRGNW